MAETLDVLKKLGKSVARGVPQLATGFVDLAALPLTMTGVRKPEQIFGSTAYLTDKGLLPQPQTGLLNESAELASSMLNPAAAAKGATVGLLGTFIGKGSKLWNAESNSIAKALEKEGLAPETIWSQTGNVKGPDGKWRQEISDVGAKFETPFTITNKINALEEQSKQSKDLLKTVNAESKVNADLFPKELNTAKKELKSNIKETEGLLSTNKYILDKLKQQNPLETTAENIYINPELYKAYPEIKQYPFLSGYAGRGYSGSFGNYGNDINVYKEAFDTGDAVSTAAHEIQHAIQGIEGFNRGGSLNNITTILQQAKPDMYMQLANEKKLLDPRIQTNMYKNLAGEAEARLTQSRLNLTPEQRLQYFPFKFAPNEYGLDRPLEDLIVHGILK
jgi:hypothetical protein